MLNIPWESFVVVTIGPLYLSLGEENDDDLHPVVQLAITIGFLAGLLTFVALIHLGYKSKYRVVEEIRGLRPTYQHSVSYEWNL